jgi:hypothetical protein
MKSFIFFLLALSVTAICFAQSNQSETLTITTYYPSPYGVYRNLKLSPSNLPTNGVDRGVMYYDNSTNKLRYYDGTVWVNITDGGGASAGDILVNAAHTKGDCRSAGGTPAASGTSFQICRIPGGSCPSGWHQYESWGTYVQTTGCCGSGTAYCVYPRHAFGSEYGLNASAWSNYRPCGLPGGTACLLHDIFHPDPHYILWADGSTYCSSATEIGCY